MFRKKESWLTHPLYHVSKCHITGCKYKWWFGKDSLLTHPTCYICLVCLQKDSRLDDVTASPDTFPKYHSVRGGMKWIHALMMYQLDRYLKRHTLSQLTSSFDDISTWPYTLSGFNYIMSFLIKGVGPGAYTPNSRLANCAHVAAARALSWQWLRYVRFGVFRTGLGMDILRAIGWWWSLCFCPSTFRDWFGQCCASQNTSNGNKTGPRATWDGLTGWYLWEVYNQGTSFETKLKFM